VSVFSESPPFRGIAFETERSVAFADYWHGLPKRDLVPSRTDFEPAAVSGLLPTFIIHDLVSPEQIVIRLAGTKLREGFGFDATGRNYLDFVDPARRPKAARAIFLVTTQPCGMLVRLISRTKAGVTYLNETFALPMRDNDGQARLVYYQSNDLPLPEYRDAASDQLVRLDLAGRTFIDIGAGIPDFRD